MQLGGTRAYIKHQGWLGNCASVDTTAIGDAVVSLRLLVSNMQSYPISRPGTHVAHPLQRRCL